jgi:hypothetical protein
MNTGRIRDLLLRAKRGEAIPGAVEELAGELLGFLADLESEVMMLKERKEKHRKTSQCEMATGHSCGGCHFYSGAIAEATDILDAFAGHKFSRRLGSKE